ncbi:MAG: HEAT repeat domain-containing protein [Gemmatimonadota bacterium]
MPGLPSLLEEAGVRDAALVVIAYLVGVLLLLSFAFAVYTFWLRFRHRARDARWNRLREGWETPVLEVLDDPGGIPALQASIPREMRLYFVRFVVEFARRVRGPELDTLRRLALPFLEPLVRRTLSGDVEVRTRAVQTLGTLGLPRYADVVVEAMDDPSPLVAMVAVRALARPEYAEFTEPVLKRLYRFHSWSRGFLSAMLAGIGSEGVPHLRKALADGEEEPWVRAVVADALAVLGDPGSGDIAAGVVEIEEDEDLLAAALRLLAVVGRPEHIDVVRVRCASPIPHVRSHALKALGVLGREEDVPRLLGAVADPSPWVALRAAEGILAAGAHPLLRDLAESDHPRALLAAQVLAEAEIP